MALKIFVWDEDPRVLSYQKLTVLAIGPAPHGEIARFGDLPPRSFARAPVPATSPAFRMAMVRAKTSWFSRLVDG